jgi:methylisocitrate lyase
MTEFGKSKLLDTRTLADLGVNLVIYPVTGLRLAMGAVEEGLRRLLVGAVAPDPGQPPTPPCQDRLYQGIIEVSQQLHVYVVHT